MWSLIADWLELSELKPAEWPHSESTLHWWKNITIILDIPRKDTRCITLLTVWVLWKERNARVFAKIKSEANAWIAAKAKDLAFILSRT
jgi:hypothetical protein